MTASSNIYVSKKSSRLFLAIALILSLFTGSGYFNTTLPPKAQVPQTELVAVIKRNTKKSIALSSALKQLANKKKFLPVAFSYLIKLHNRLIKIRLDSCKNYTLPIHSLLYLSPLKNIPASADEAPPTLLPG